MFLKLQECFIVFPVIKWLQQLMTVFALFGQILQEMDNSCFNISLHCF